MYTQKKQKYSIRFFPYFIASYGFCLSVSANFIINPRLQVTDPGGRRQRSSSKNLPKNKKAVIMLRLLIFLLLPNIGMISFLTGASDSFEDNGRDERKLIRWPHILLVPNLRMVGGHF